MSISRKNWSALSSLARQWTMEDEEEVERERRRRVKSSTTTDPDDESSPPPRDKSTTSGPETQTETSQGLSSVEQIQVDFVEMLRMRDEKRRMRHVETLRRQKEDDDDNTEGKAGGGREEEKEKGARVEVLGDVDDEDSSVFTTQPAAPKTITHSPMNIQTSSHITTRQHENGESSDIRDPDPDPKPPSRPARKFVSSVSISLDKSPSASGPPTPMSPCSPTMSPCLSRSAEGRQSPVQNGHTQKPGVNGSASNEPFEQTSKPAFVRQSSRTVSFRMMKKKEEETSPALQRSASVRMASKKFESNTEQNEDENKESSFQRNSRQRVSSRSIQEKMERLAQAAQKSELTRYPDVAQRTLFLLDEVSRKRGMFEKDPPAQSQTSPGASRQEFRGFTSGMSDRINRWLNKSNQSSQNPSELRHVDISSKRSLFERIKGEDKTSPGKLTK